MNNQSLIGNAELALASYAALNTSPLAAQIPALRNAGLSGPQADSFASRYQVVAQFNDTPAEGGLGTSFSATVFRDGSGNLTLAMRGTLEAGDFVPTDLNIWLDGAGYDQIVAMANWWRRASAPQGLMVQQHRVVPYGVGAGLPSAGVFLYSGPGVLYFLEPGPAVAATGELAGALGADADRRVDVVGHSLGGHLAMAFNTLFSATVGQVTVFNAPGFKDSATNQQFFAMLGGAVPGGSDSGNVTNVIANESGIGKQPWNAVAGLHSRPGVAVDVPIENQWQSDEPNAPGALNHSQMILTDSLAVFALLARLAPTLSVTSFEALLGSAALGTAASLERIADALARTLGVNSSPLPAGNANRNALYEAIYALQSAPAYRALEGSAALRVLAEVNAATLEAGSKTDFGYFVAVRELLPFALEGAGSVLIEAHPELYARWSADRAKRIAGASDLEFTDAWLADRAAFLGWKLLANSADVTTILDAAYVAGSRLRYSDLPSGFTVTVSNAVLAPSDDSAKRFVFGGDGADALSGGSLSDRLYGDRGPDLLAGGRGDDYLEGGAGMDVYEYRASSGMLGSANDGADTIRDTDGRGVLRYSFDGASRAIAGAASKVGDGKWQSPDGKFAFDQQGSDLVVTINGDAGGTLLLKDYRDGDFGIRLMGPLADPAPQNFDIRGDLAPVDFDPSAAGVQSETNSLGNVITDPNSPAPEREDLLYDSPDSDFIFAGGGDDVVVALRGGGDWVQGGAGRDCIQGGSGADLIEGRDRQHASPLAKRRTWQPMR